MNKIRFISLAVAAVLVFCCFAACGKKDSGNADANTATVILVDENEKEYTYTLHKTGVDLKTALIEEGLVKKEDSASLFVEVIDGHEALMEDGFLWLLCDENKDQIMGFFEETEVKAGKTYYLVYTVAPNFDD